MLVQRDIVRRDADRLRGESRGLAQRAVAQKTASRELCEQLSALHRRAPILRCLHLRGASDRALDRDQRRLIREKIRTRELPRGGCRSMLTGRGTGVDCDGCQRPITETDRLVEADFVDGQSLFLHFACFRDWCVEADAPIISADPS